MISEHLFWTERTKIETTKKNSNEVSEMVLNVSFIYTEFRTDVLSRYTYVAMYTSTIRYPEWYVYPLQFV